MCLHQLVASFRVCYCLVEEWLSIAVDMQMQGSQCTTGQSKLRRPEVTQYARNLLAPGGRPAGKLVVIYIEVSRS